MSCAKSLLLIVLALACIMPMTAFAQNEEKALDYSKEDNWVEAQKTGTKAVDVFFIYPTICEDTENKDGYNSVEEMKQLANLLKIIIKPIYEDSCNFYMPLYRQASMRLAYTCNKDNATYLKTLYEGKAYLDIKAALDYYFENNNKGKPFILAGHSQGSAMVLNVLTHYMQEHKEYLSRMVAAYVIGFAPSEEIFNETTGLKFATREDDYNVVISFNTEGPNAEGKTILLPEKPMVINPLTWTTDDTYGSVEMNKGFATLAPTRDSIQYFPGKDDAQINLTRKTIVSKTRTPEEYSVAPECFATESLHEKEMFMYFVNLKHNVKTRVDKYLAEQAK